MIMLVDYASPSTFESSRTEAALDLAVNRRRPVRFHGVVARHGFNLRIALRALGEAIAEPCFQPREIRQLAAGFTRLRHLIVVNMRLQRTVQGHSQRRQAEAPSSIEKKMISARPTKFSKGT